MTMASYIHVSGQLIASLVFFALTIMALVKSKAHLQSALFVVACGVTAVWAAVGAIAAKIGLPSETVPKSLDLARSLAWLAFLASLLAQGSFRPSKPGTYPFQILGAIAGLALLVALLVLDQVVAEVATWLFLALALLVLVLIENVLRNMPPQRRWGFKLLFVGIGSLFLYDTILHTSSLVGRDLEEVMSQARGGISAVAGIVLAFALHRSKVWRGPFSISRQIAFYTLALAVSMVYALLVLLASLYIWHFGGTEAAALQTIVLFASGVLFLVLLFSGTVRAYLKLLVSRHFFAYRYDYRREWRRFTDTISQSRESASLEERVVRGIADVVESPAGGLWYRHAGRFAIACGWNMTLPSLGMTDSWQLEKLLTENEWIVELEEGRDRPEKLEGFSVPRVFTTVKDAWVIVPLLHHSVLNGIVILAQPRVRRPLDWEDHELLKIMGRQAAGYLAEQRTAEALAEDQEFEKFSRRTAFVIHDMKSLVSQLTLICSNFRRHGGKESFRRDVIYSMESVVLKMKRLLERLGSDVDARSMESSITLKSLLQNLSPISEGKQIEFRCDSDDEELCIAGDQDQLEALLGHIVGNALEAVDGKGTVSLAVREIDGMAIIEVSDDGSGMESSFVQEEYFKLFRSTKRNGFGMGGYQCREYARQLGGDLTVLSVPGLGTTVRITLPVASNIQVLNDSVAVSSLR